MKNKKAFTLVELIVTITILAILGTIAFIAFQGYSKNSRDSVRISDISKMKTALEIFIIDAGKYPLPTDNVEITYSGGTVWEQGIFGETTFTNVDKLDRIPTDPLTNSLYSFSVTQNRREFEIGGVAEGDDLAHFDLLDTSYAGNTIAKALIVGNYNGKVLKSLSGTTCDILSVPSIIASDLDLSTDLVDILANKKLAYKGFNNLPPSFKNSKFKFNGGFDFTPKKLLIYSDTGSCIPLATDATLRLNLFNYLIDSYTGTLVSDLVNDDGIPEYCSKQERKLIDSKFLVESAIGIDTYGDNSIECVQDSIAPIITDAGPTGTIISSGATLSVTTNENATCKYDLNDVSYNDMTNSFSTTGGTNHSSPYTASAGANSLFIKCSDSFGNKSLPTNIIFTYEYAEPVNVEITPASGGTYTCESCN